jgi:hypothetical protein
VEDLGVVVAVHLDVGAQERGEDTAVGRELAVVLTPLHPPQRLLRGLPRPRLGRLRSRGERAAEIVLLEEELHPDAAPPHIQQAPELW